MKLIFIRHGDPDYEHNTVTDKGRRECALLAERASAWHDVAGVFVSPYGRAQETAKPLLAALSCKGETMPWLREFSHRIIYPRTGEERSVCWDWFPRDYLSDERHFDREHWHQTETFRAAGLEQHYTALCDGFDAVLASYGYRRPNRRTPVYTCRPHLDARQAAVDTHLEPFQPDTDARTLVFVCHLGVMFAIIAHLTAISPMQLWQGFFVAPSSVTVLGAEERVPGEVVFRVQLLGDVRHLTEHGEPPSASGFFGNVTAF